MICNHRVKETSLTGTMINLTSFYSVFAIINNIIYILQNIFSYDIYISLYIIHMAQFI